MKTVNYNSVMKAMHQAMLEFDAMVILEIAENKEGGWMNGCEILNELSYDQTKYYLSLINEKYLHY